LKEKFKIQEEKEKKMDGEKKQSSLTRKGELLACSRKRREERMRILPKRDVSFRHICIIRIEIIALLFFLICGAAQAYDWPMFRNDPHHTGCTNENIKDLKLLWRFETEDSIWSSPAIVRGKVFIGSLDHNIYCLDENNGKLVWLYKTEGWVISSPAVADGKVVVGSLDGYIYCLDANTGALIWRFMSGPTHSSPTIKDGKVFVGSDYDKVYCLNLSTGEVIWEYKTDDDVKSSPAVADGKVFVGASDGYVYCIDEQSGSLIWKYRTANDIESSPAVAKGKVFIGSNDDWVYCLDASDGNLIWRYKTKGDVVSSPAVSDGKVFICSKDATASFRAPKGKIYCFDASHGDLIWDYETEGDIVSSPAVADGKVFIGSRDGKLYCFDENKGNIIWTYETENEICSSPAIADSKVFICSRDHRIYCFGASYFNKPPVIMPIGDKEVNEGELLMFKVNAIDVDNDTLIFSAENMPEGAEFENGTFRWTPSHDQAGNYTVVFVVSDGKGEDRETVNIEVINVSPSSSPVLIQPGDREKKTRTHTYIYQDQTPSPIPTTTPTPALLPPTPTVPPPVSQIQTHISSQSLNPSSSPSPTPSPATSIFNLIAPLIIITFCAALLTLYKKVKKWKAGRATIKKITREYEAKKGKILQIIDNIIRDEYNKYTKERFTELKNAIESDELEKVKKYIIEFERRLSEVLQYNV